MPLSVRIRSGAPEVRKISAGGHPLIPKRGTREALAPTALAHRTCLVQLEIARDPLHLQAFAI